MEKNEEKELVIQGSTLNFRKQMKLNCVALRHHYSTFNVGRSMFDVHLLKNPLCHKSNLRMFAKQHSA